MGIHDLDDVIARRQAAALAIVNCELCDEHGYRGNLVCDHVDHWPAAQRGLARCRAVLADVKKRKHQAAS